jgi:hypothetical protein
MPAQTRFEVFVTLAWPTTVSEFPDITYRRMKHAVTKVSEAAHRSPCDSQEPDGQLQRV